jgi:hypothetical protein
MIDEETTGRWKRLGFKDPSAFYFLGRGGVLGDGVDASVVTAAMGWFEPGFMRSQWTEGAEVASPRRTARHYGQACAEWARSIWLTLITAPGWCRWPNGWRTAPRGPAFRCLLAGGPG